MPCAVHELISEFISLFHSISLFLSPSPSLLPLPLYRSGDGDLFLHGSGGGDFLLHGSWDGNDEPVLRRIWPVAARGGRIRRARTVRRSGLPPPRPRRRDPPRPRRWDLHHGGRGRVGAAASLHHGAAGSARRLRRGPLRATGEVVAAVGSPDPSPVGLRTGSLAGSWFFCFFKND